LFSLILRLIDHTTIMQLCNLFWSRFPVIGTALKAEEEPGRQA
jgi:hypothetical protein